MCLTEPTAGSDVGDLLSKAYPTDEPGIYKLKGQKIFITAGDRDDVENIIHLYLARIEGAAPGTKGLSLFIMPKYWVNEEEPWRTMMYSVRGGAQTGLEGSATAALVVGENNNCEDGCWEIRRTKMEEPGYSSDVPYDERGRVDTDVSTAVAANAYWNAVAYGRDGFRGVFD